MITVLIKPFNSQTATIAIAQDVIVNKYHEQIYQSNYLSYLISNLASRLGPFCNIRVNILFSIIKYIIIK